MTNQATRTEAKEPHAEHEARLDRELFDACRAELEEDRRAQRLCPDEYRALRQAERYVESYYRHGTPTYVRALLRVDRARAGLKAALAAKAGEP